ncbi:hypothetical protein GCM10023170_004050 [Phytohabitans houttuyneae]|uniref:Uncharacterized protein n=1 Tax=Phytohabitans houttuyneae TaxID=1076126 RepID=A0A6V8K8Y7_9ACTN|nr:hypothetical protein Phou_029480 [Phytohabitans houttuyneae]
MTHRNLAGKIPVDRAAARRREQLLQLSHELLHLLRIVGVGRLGTRESEAERDIRHVTNGTPGPGLTPCPRCQLRVKPG